MKITKIMPFYKGSAAAVSCYAAHSAVSEKENCRDFIPAAYPSGYYTYGSISFGRSISHARIIREIGEENFPSPVIAERFASEYDKTLYEIHKDHYKKLLDCKSLDEAKEIYPEFQDVIDAKDIDISEYKDIKIFKKIKDGKKKGVTIDNLTLELLKKRFALVNDKNRSSEYFNITPKALKHLFSALNIQDINRRYMYRLYSSNPDFQADQRKNLASKWAEDDGTMRAVSSAIAKQYLCASETQGRSAASRNSTECRAKQSLNMKKRWAEDDGTMRTQASEHAEKVLHSDEMRQRARAAQADAAYRKKHSETITRFFESERGQKYKEARRLAAERHPEFNEQIALLRKEFPSIGRAMHRIQEGRDTLSDRKIQSSYWKRFHEMMPEYEKTIGREYHDILVEWGLIE